MGPYWKRCQYGLTGNVSSEDYDSNVRMSARYAQTMVMLTVHVDSERRQNATYREREHTPTFVGN